MGEILIKSSAVDKYFSYNSKEENSIKDQRRFIDWAIFLFLKQNSLVTIVQGVLQTRAFLSLSVSPSKDGHSVGTPQRMYAIFTVRRLPASRLENWFLSLNWRRIDIPTIVRGRFAMKLVMLQSEAAHYTDPKKSPGRMAVGFTVFLDFVIFP